MADLECPYCGKDVNVCHDDGFGYEEGVSHQMECPHCEKNFIFQTTISFYYNAYPADCLNGAEHNWKPTTTFPQIFARMRCSVCDEERRPTEEEMKSIIENENGNSR